VNRTQSVTPFVECPNCHKLLDVQATQCTECRELISREYATLSAFANVVNTRACNLAKEIVSRDRIFAPVFVAASIFLHFLNARSFGSLVFFWIAVWTPAIQLLIVAAWHARYRKFPLGDSAFARARRQVTWSGRLWGWILALQVAVLLAGR